MLVSLQPNGARLLERVVEQRIIELRANGRALVAAISSLLEPAGENFDGERWTTEKKRCSPDQVIRLQPWTEMT